MNAEDTLNECRDRIDDVDRRILTLLNERTEIVTVIARVKAEAQLPVYEPKREEEVFRNIANGNRGPLSNDAAKRIFERIIDEMRKFQRERMAQRGANLGDPVGGKSGEGTAC
jgi:chorismate mutase-like protein